MGKNAKPKSTSQAGARTTSNTSRSPLPGGIKNVPIMRSVTDSILNAEGDPIDFHKDRTGQTILKAKRDDDYTPTFEPEHEYFDESTIREFANEQSKEKSSTSQPPESRRENSEDDPPSSSSDEENEDDYNSKETDSPSKREKVGGKVQLGFSGLPKLESHIEHSVFVSNQTKFRLDGASTLNHEGMRKFVAQVKNNNFKVDIEDLIDDLSWLQILIIAKGMNQDSNSISESSRLKDLEQLDAYVNREEGQLVELDNTVWNNLSICRLLLECYPAKSGTSNSSDTFTTRCLEISPCFDLMDNRVERKFVHQVGTLL